MVDALLVMMAIVCALSLLFMPVLALYVGTGHSPKVIAFGVGIFAATWVGYLTVGTIFDPTENHGMMASAVLFLALPISAVLSWLLWIIGRKSRPKSE